MKTSRGTFELLRLTLREDANRSMIVIIAAPVPIPVMVMIPIVMVVSVVVFGMAVISTAFFDGAPGCR